MSASETFLGTLGNREGVNVAKVEVSWYFEDPGLGFETTVEEHFGYFLVHATGDEECVVEDPEYGTIYTVFENLTHEAMQRRQERQGFAGYEIDDISAA